MQDDEQGLDAAIDDVDEAQLHFRFGSELTSEHAQQLNVPLQVFQADPKSTLPNPTQELLPPLPILHAVVLSPHSIGIIVTSAEGGCVDDASIAALPLLGKCRLACSDATFVERACGECRMHWASYVVTC